MKESWRRRQGEVVVEGTMPPDVVCECGSNSSPKAVARAEAISTLPDVLRFIEKLLVDVPVEEKMNRRECLIRVNQLSIDNFLAFLRNRGVELKVTYLKSKKVRSESTGVWVTPVDPQTEVTA